MFKPLLSSNGKIFADDQKMQWYISSASGAFNNVVFDYKDIKEVFVTDGKALSTKTYTDKKTGVSNIGRNAAIFALTGVAVASVKTSTKTTVKTKQIDVCNVNVILKSSSTPIVFQCQNELMANSLLGELRRMKENGEKYSTHRPLYGLEELKKSPQSVPVEKPSKWKQLSMETKFMLYSFGVIIFFILVLLISSGL